MRLFLREWGRDAVHMKWTLEMCCIGTQHKSTFTVETRDVFLTGFLKLTGNSFLVVFGSKASYLFGKHAESHCSKDGAVRMLFFPPMELNVQLSAFSGRGRKGKAAMASSSS